MAKDKDTNGIADAYFDALGFDASELTPQSDRTAETERPFEVEPLEAEPRTLEDDPAFTELLESVKRSTELAEQASKTASASSIRSRISLAVSVFAALATAASLSFMVWEHFSNPSTPDSEAGIESIRQGSSAAQCLEPPLVSNKSATQ